MNSAFYLATCYLKICRINIKVKVKCTLVQALRLSTGRTAHRKSRGIALLFLDHGTIRGWGVSVTPRPSLPPGKDPVPIVQEAGWAPGPVWTGAENLASTGIRSPDRPARSQSLYRLRYPAQRFNILNWNFVRCFCGYEICSLARREEYSLLAMSENELLRRMLGSMIKEVRGWWWHLHVRAFIIDILQNMIFVRWSRSMRWTGKVRNIH